MAKSTPFYGGYWYSPYEMEQKHKDVDSMKAGSLEYDSPTKAKQSSLAASQAISDQLGAAKLIPNQIGLGEISARQSAEAIGQRYAGAGGKGLAEALQFGKQGGAQAMREAGADARNMQQMKLEAVRNAGRNRVAQDMRETKMDQLMAQREVNKGQSKLGWAGLQRAATNAQENFYLEWLLLQQQEKRIQDEVARQKGQLDEDFWWSLGIGGLTAATAMIPGVGTFLAPVVNTGGKILQNQVQKSSDAGGAMAQFPQYQSSLKSYNLPAPQLEGPPVPELEGPPAPKKGS